MSTYIDTEEKKVENNTKIAGVISENWKNKGYLEKYGPDFLIWILGFLIPDLQEVKEKESNKRIKEEIKQIILSNGLNKYHKDINLMAREQWRYLYK